MDFKKYLYELLLENETVIIPGFGAFISEYKPAEINPETGEIAPPSKIISFSQQIKNNDGLLVGHVAEQLNISHFEALLKIEKERENILYKLDNGEQVQLESIGTLFFTKENQIAFTPEESENLLLDSFGLESTNIEATEPVEETIPEAVIATEELPETSEPEEIIEEIQEEEPVEEEKEEIEETNIIPEENQEHEPAEELPTNEPIDEPVPPTPPVQEEKKKKRGWLWLLILIPLGAVAVFVFMKGNMDGFSGKTKVEESSINIIEVPDTVISMDTVQTDTIAPPVMDSTGVETQDNEIKEEEGPKFYLVGGSFSVKENADTYLNELKAKGFNAFHAGQKGKFYCIGIAVFDSFSDAEKAQKEYMINNPGMELWVWRK